MTGLAGDVVVISNAGNAVNFTSNGSQIIATLADNSAYNLSITSQPNSPSQTCGFTNGDNVGTLSGSDVTVEVNCVTDTFTLSANVTGLAGDVVVISNAGNAVNFTSNGSQTIATLDDGSAYNMSITTQPDSPQQICSFTNGDNVGTLSGSDVTVEVNCVTDTFTVSANVTGLAGDVVVISNAGNAVNFTSNGTQTIATLDDGSAYNLSITTQPDSPSQTCGFTNGDNTGTLNGADVTVEINCTTNTYFIGGTVSGLLRNNALVLQNNNANDKIIFTNGTFIFSTPLSDSSPYDVTVITNPSSPLQTCTVTNSTGTLSGDDVTDVAVICEYLESNDLIYRHGFEDEAANL